MAGVLRISDAVSIGLHTMLVLAGDQERSWTSKALAARLRVSEAHLAKVMQRLVRVGLVRSTRGPKGGFNLSRPAESVALLEVYEAIEGPLEDRHCLLPQPVCRGKCCMLGSFVRDLNSKLRTQLARTRLDTAARWLQTVPRQGTGSGDRLR